MNTKKRIETLEVEAALNDMLGLTELLNMLTGATVPEGCEEGYTIKYWGAAKLLEIAQSVTARLERAAYGEKLINCEKAVSA